MKKQMHFLSVISLLAVTLGCFNATADVPSGRFRLHLDTPILGVGVGELDWEGPGGENDFEGFQVGVGTPGMGIGFGGTLGRGIVIGGKATLAMASSDWFLNDDSEIFVWSLVPYFEYVFLSGVARPFVMAQLGFEGAHDSPGDTDYGWWSLLFGIGGGAHFFLADKLSVDAILQLQQRFGTGRLETPATETDFSHWRFSMGILFGISAWL